MDININIANNRIYEIDKKINDLLDQKERELSKVLPSSRNFETEKVFTSRMDKNKNLHYVIAVDEIDIEIDYLYKEKEIFLDYIDKELVRLKKYHEVEELIVYYRENKLKKYTWDKIASLVGLSERHCRRIYQKIKQLRNV